MPTRLLGSRSLTASYGGNANNTASTSAAVTLTVGATTIPLPVATLGQSTTTTTASTQFTLTWGSTNATACVIEKSLISGGTSGPWGPTVQGCGGGPAGSCYPGPTLVGTHLFRNICTGPGGTSLAEMIIHTVTPPRPVATIGQSDLVTPAGTPFTLTWGSTGATACVIEKALMSGGTSGPWGPTVQGCGGGPAGSCYPGPTIVGTHQFRNICTGPGGTSLAVAVNHVVTIPPPVATLDQSTTTTTPGTKFTLTWGSTGATACVIEKALRIGNSLGPWGPTVQGCGGGPAGSCYPGPAVVGAHIFRNICTGPGGISIAATVYHTVQ